MVIDNQISSKYLSPVNRNPVDRANFIVGRLLQNCWGTGAPTLDIESTDFISMGSIPKRHAQEGKNLSPALDWSLPPTDTVEYLLICEDPDAPKRQPVLHWMLYNIPAHVQQLPEGILNEECVKVPDTARQGKNEHGVFGYMGPKPPKGDGIHRYFFQLFALNRKLLFADINEKEQLLGILEDAVIGYGELAGTYETV